MTIPHPVVSREREEFRRKSQELVTQGRLDEAIQLCIEVLEGPERAQDVDLRDQAHCLRAGLLIARGEGEEPVGELRKILMRSSDLANRFAAAYAISHFYDLVGDSEKSLFYARRALHCAEDWDDREARSRAHNVIGNLLILDSYFDQAQEAYSQALELQASVESIDRSILLSNLGYCRLINGCFDQGYRDLCTSLRMMRRIGAESWQHLPRLGLSYACLEVDRPERARNHAQQALHWAELTQTPGSVKNSLYLLGESEKQCGRVGIAYDRFTELQRRFYPDNPMVVDVLMAADVRKMINLMA